MTNEKILAADRAARRSELINHLIWSACLGCAGLGVLLSCFVLVFRLLVIL